MLENEVPRPVKRSSSNVKALSKSDGDACRVANLEPNSVLGFHFSILKYNVAKEI